MHRGVYTFLYMSATGCSATRKKDECGHGIMHIRDDGKNMSSLLCDIMYYIDSLARERSFHERQYISLHVSKLDCSERSILA